MSISIGFFQPLYHAQVNNVRESISNLRWTFPPIFADISFPIIVDKLRLHVDIFIWNCNVFLTLDTLDYYYMVTEAFVDKQNVLEHFRGTYND